ncbi:MAG: hypothetical protein ACD_23C00746G0001 [uncultured bacterium]|nr:MAG: hypothetical protein ACD_23C00746G0001 [uncultured bacterium]
MRGLGRNVLIFLIGPVGQTVKNWQNEQREQCGRENSTDYYRCQRPLNFGACACSDGHGNEAQRCHERSHEHWPQPGQSAFANRCIKPNTVLPQAADVGNHHQPVEHCYARECNEAHGSGDGHRDIAQPQRQDAPRQSEWDARKDQQSILGISEHCEQQDEDKQQGNRHNNLQALGCRLQVFKGAAPARPVAGRNLDLGQALFSLRYERTHVATPHIGAHHDTSLAVLAADLVGARGKLERRHLTQRDEIGLGLRTTLRARQRYGQPLHRFQIIADGLGETDQNVESTISFKHRACLPSADGRSHGVLDVSNVQPIACGLLAVDVHGQHRKARRLLDLHLRGALDLLQHR